MVYLYATFIQHQENVSSVMEQLDALKNVKDKFDSHIEKHGTGFIAQIDDSIAGEFTVF